MLARTSMLVPFLFAVAACTPGTTEIDDPAMEANGVQAGEQSTQLGENEADAEDDAIVADVQLLGSTYQSLVGQHQAYAAASINAVPEVDGGVLALAGEDSTVSWDGEHMVLNWSIDESGLLFQYDLDLTFTDSAEGGKTINGHYNFDYVAASGGAGLSYDIDVTYDAMTSDSAGCLVSGSVTITYAITVDAGGFGGFDLGGYGDQSGTVVVAYGGCDTVTVSGT